MTDDTDLTRTLEALNATDWFGEYAPDVSMDSGADATAISVDRDGVTIHGHEKFGDGRTPYADDPTAHIEMLNHPDETRGEGAVVYEDGPTSDDYPLELPKQLYFEERRAFDGPATDIDDLEAKLNRTLGVEVAVRELVGTPA